MKRHTAHRRGDTKAQALVEFSLVLIPFLLILMGIFDLGRGIYMQNGIAEAAREIARVTAVHQCASPCSLGNSAETTGVVATQKGMVPGLGGPGASITFACTALTGTIVPGSPCAGGNFIRVTVSVPFSVITPVLSMVAPSTLSSTARIEVP